jgi:16S rRNA (guanine527-N7)-methyltransferase
VFRGFNDKRVLDFGTGGGMPGIPVKLLFPGCEMTLLDSTKKKIEMIKSFETTEKAKSIKLISERLENLEYERYYDIILCRSVKITKEIKAALERVLKKKGVIFLYKAQQLSDVEVFDKYKIHNLSPKIIGERKIVEINY